MRTCPFLLLLKLHHPAEYAQFVAAVIEEEEEEPVVKIEVRYFVKVGEYGSQSSNGMYVALAL